MYICFMMRWFIVCRDSTFQYHHSGTTYCVFEFNTLNSTLDFHQTYVLKQKFVNTNTNLKYNKSWYTRCMAYSKIIITLKRQNLPRLSNAVDTAIHLYHWMTRNNRPAARWRHVDAANSTSFSRHTKNLLLVTCRRFQTSVKSTLSRVFVRNCSYTFLGRHRRYNKWKTY